MPRIVGTYDPRIGPVITVEVSDPISDRPEYDSPKTERVTLLIDSGASGSAISGAVASRLSLPVLGYHKVAGFGSTNAVIQYLADIDLYLDTVFSLSGRLLLRFDYGGGAIQGVIGRDIIGMGRFIMDGLNRQFTFEIN